MFELEMIYKNYKGEVGKRRVHIKSGFLQYSSNEFYPRKQWLLTAFDLDKNVWREFALENISYLNFIDGDLQQFIKLNKEWEEVKDNG